jgi:hypothetical protein
MKISEIHLDEVPAGTLGQMGKKLGAKVLSKVPSNTAKSKAANMAGKVDLGNTANDFHKQFSQYVGQIGKDASTATGEDLQAFLKKNNHKTSTTIPSGVLQKQQLDSIMMSVAKEVMAGKGADGAAPTDNKDAPSGAAQDVKVQFTPNQQVLFVSKSGKATSATVVGKSMDGDDDKVAVQGQKGQKFNVPRGKLLDPKTKQPFKPSAPGKPSKSAPAPKMPVDLKNQIQSLSDEQKKQLVSML